MIKGYTEGYASNIHIECFKRGKKVNRDHLERETRYQVKQVCKEMKAYSKDNEFVNRLLERVLDDQKYKRLEDIIWTKQDGGILKDIR